MTSASPFPREGAKLLLERQSTSEDASRAEYRGHIYTPERRYDLRVSLDTSGEAELAPIGERAQPELAKALENIAKSIARAAARKHEDGLPPWPRRIHRWRGPGRGPSGS